MIDWRTEFFGNCIEISLSGGFQVLPTPGRHDGSCRLIRVNQSAPSLVVLPDASICTLGEAMSIHNTSPTHILLVADSQANTIHFVPTTSVTEAVLINRGAGGTAGTWAFRDTSVEVGPSLVFDRISLDFTFERDLNSLHLRDFFNDRGYDGSKPASIRVQLGRPGRSYVFGADPTSYAFDSGDWPSGTTLLLFNYATVVGRGGNGGRGGDVPPGLLASAGANGTEAMRLRIDTSIVNFGSIRGGGGGGGGGSATAAISGSGGGGGAGHPFSYGGNPGSPGAATVGANGVNGGAFGPGGGGNPGQPGAGGSGGFAGQSGQAGTGAAGGAPGYAILRAASATVTKIVAGAIFGPEGVL